MSFSSEVKDEISHRPPQKQCCQKAWLKAFFHFGPLEGSVLNFSGAQTARFLARILHDLKIGDWGMGITKTRSRHRGRIIFGRVPRIPRVPASPCCVKSYLQAAFLLRGSIVHPRHGSHLEMYAADRKVITGVRNFLRRLGYDPGIYVRRNRFVAYLKNGDHISDFIRYLGASLALLRFEETRALKETKNSVRREVNYESANLGRVVRGAENQKKMVEGIISAGKWKKLPGALRKAAEGRLKHPHLSLRDLAVKLGISKSALNHRFRRIAVYAG